MEIVGVPEGFEVVYEDNTATDAGVYYAKAKLVNPADTNYREVTLPECRWEIAKAGIRAMMSSLAPLFKLPMSQKEPVHI